MVLNSREIRRLNIKSFSNRRCLWRCCRCCLNWFLLLGQRASTSSFYHLFVRLPSLCLGVCLLCTRLSKHFSAVHSVVIVCARDIRLLFKLLVKFRNRVLKHTESRSSLACNQNIRKKTSPQRWRLSFALKRNEAKRRTYT